MNFFPNRLPDIDIIIKNERPSKNFIASGYRPAFKVNNNYLTTGIIKFLECEELQFGEQTVAQVWFLTPECYPHCLKIGQVIPYQEGSIIKGYAKIIAIHNKLLETTNSN